MFLFRRAHNPSSRPVRPRALLLLLLLALAFREKAPPPRRIPAKTANYLRRLLQVPLYFQFPQRRRHSLLRSSLPFHRRRLRVRKRRTVFVVVVCFEAKFCFNTPSFVEKTCPLSVRIFIIMITNLPLLLKQPIPLLVDGVLCDGVVLTSSTTLCETTLLIFPIGRIIIIIFGKRIIREMHHVANEISRVKASFLLLATRKVVSSVVRRHRID
mmetsp:Transcript_7965/g.25051  ORF Transcript_7965/g.25051 Transcript_7965/m.25051 type:complete len:213 (-) Transcript_7965:52-690(-)